MTRMRLSPCTRGCRSRRATSASSARTRICPSATSNGSPSSTTTAVAQSIRRLLTPRSVAVIGASEERFGVGRAVLDNLLSYAFNGEVHVVHPTAKEVASVAAYPSVLDIPGSVDLAVVALPAESVLEV